ncbi:MAG: hypothetical protein V7L11_05350 [Nostoc sp.]|uniref:hypothetical protein n=1 Tax=Nostoc sp. TaxID=1180 RepID=UPI002FFACAA6
MPRLYINAELRRLVADRAAHLCDYCLYPELDGLGFQVANFLQHRVANLTQVV